MILVAILFPPLAVLICGKPVQAVINFFLTLCLWIPGMIHAILVVNARNADRRHKEMMLAMANRPAPAPAGVQAPATVTVEPALPTPPTAPTAHMEAAQPEE